MFPALQPADGVRAWAARTGSQQWWSPVACSRSACIMQYANLTEGAEATEWSQSMPDVVHADVQPLTSSDSC